MSDRELLELAAKAAGYVIDFADCRDCGGWTDYRIIPGGYWNPIKDDADALRLAVKLNLHILRFDTMTTVRRVGSDCGFDERDDGDSLRATRRAIVRAAAEIGRTQ